MANPFIALGGVAVVAAGAAVGFIAVPGWVAQAQDSLAIGDLGAIRDAQSAYYDINGEWALDQDELGKDPEWGTKVELSQGVRLNMEVTSKGWCAVAESASGHKFGTSSVYLAIKEGTDDEAILDVVCDQIVELFDPTGGNLTVARTGDHPDMALTATVGNATCRVGQPTYRIASRYTTTADEGEWSDWGWSTDRTLTVKPAYAGALYEFKAQVKCVRSSKESGAVDLGPVTYITSIPTPSPTLALDPEGQGLKATTTVTCYADTTPIFGFRYRKSLTSDMGGWGAWTQFSEDNTYTVAGPPTPGARHEVESRVRCITPYTQSPAADAPSRAKIVPFTSAPAVPTIKLTIKGETATTTVSNTCTSGYTPEYTQSREVRNKKTDIEWGGDSSKQTVDGTLREGYRIDARGRIRCATVHATSPWTSYGKVDGVRAITTKPDVTVTDMKLVNTDNVRVYATIGGCPTGTTYESRLRKQVNEGDWATGSWAADSAGSGNWTSSGTINQGAWYKAGVEVRCVTEWADGPGTTKNHLSDVRDITTTPQAEAIAKLDRATGKVTANIDIIKNCPTGTQFYWRFTDRENSGDWAAWIPNESGAVSKDGVLGWYKTAGAKTARTIGWGDKATVKVQYICATEYTKGDSATDSMTTAERALSTPAAKAIAILNGASLYANVNITTGCTYGTFKWRAHGKINSGSYGSYTSWGTTESSKDTGKDIAYGNSGTIEVQYACFSGDVHSDYKYATAGTGVRKAPVPTAPTVTITSLYAGENGRGLASAVWTSTTSTNADKYEGYGRAYFNNGTYSTSTTKSNTTRTWGMGCEGTNTVGLLSFTGFVRAVNDTGASAWASKNRVRNGGDATRLCS